MTKFEDIEFWDISRTHEYGCNLLQTILDKRLRLSSMFQNSYRFNIYIFVLTNEIRPHKSHAYHGHKPSDAFYVAHVGVLDVEAGRFHGLEDCLDLPAFLISQNGTVGTVEAYEDLQFRDSIGVFNPTACKIDIFSLVDEDLMVELLLSHLEVVEEPLCTFPLTGGRLDR